MHVKVKLKLNMKIISEDYIIMNKNKEKYLHEMKELVSIRNCLESISVPDKREAVVRVKERFNLRMNELFDSLIKYVDD